MALRATLGLAAAAFFALSACSGGGNSSPTIPRTDVPQSLSSGSSAAAYVAYPTGAPAGVRIYVHLPLRNSSALDQLIAAQSTKNSSHYHQWLTPAQFREQYGPTVKDLQSVASALSAQGFKTAITSQGVVADAPQALVERVFGITLRSHTFAAVRGSAPITLLAADKAPTLPPALTAVNAQVAAFAPLPAMRPHILRTTATPIAENRYSDVGPYWFDDLKQAYQYPAYQTANGSGRTEGIIAASDFLDSDMSIYFGHELLAVPTIVRRLVDGGGPPPTISNPDSIEVETDIQQAGGSAPGAKFVVYEAPDASVVPSFLDMYTAVVDDNEVDVVNTSFGLCELDFTAAYNDGVDFSYLFGVFHDIFRQGNAQGITFVNASGDFGGLGCADPTGETAIAGVEWPADDTDVTGVGGTNLVTSFVSGSLRSTYVSENAFYDPIAPGLGYPAGEVFGSGGGKSVIFQKPLYQYLVNTGAATRTVPDVAMHMGGCPAVAVQPCGPDRSADILVFDGAGYGVVGTSESAQEFGGLQAVQEQVLGSRAGNANYLIYGLAVLRSIGNGPIYHENVPGNNGVYSTNPGYNYVLGNGTPYGAQYSFDPFGPQAGDPQTPSNP
jgi:kumamolisin